jgi:hypothetical protein
MSKLSRRSLVSSAVMLPALAVPAVAADVGSPDAELLALGVQLEAVIRNWSTQAALDEKRREAWELACVAAGLPRIPFGSLPRAEWHDYQEKRSKVRAANFQPEEEDENGVTVDWAKILERRNLLVDDILSDKRAQSPALRYRHGRSRCMPKNSGPTTPTTQSMTLATKIMLGPL